MKLNENMTTKLIDIVTTANNIGINSMIIDSDSFRGSTDNNAVLLLHKNNNSFDTTEFDGIGISRVAILSSRLNLLKNSTKVPQIEFDLKVKDNGIKNVLRMRMKQNSTNIDFKCVDPNLINAKKNMLATIAYSFKMKEDTVDLMTKSKSAMDYSKICLILANGELNFKLQDVEGDSLTHLVSDSVEIFDGADKEFCFNYSDKTILPLLRSILRSNSQIDIKITQKGTMNLLINNYNVFIPKEI